MVVFVQYHLRFSLKKYFLADLPPKSGLYVHPEGPFTGSQLNQIPISFEKMKLSNSSSGPNGKILMLASMLKYKPRIYLIQGKINIDTYIENRPRNPLMTNLPFK